MLEVRFTRGARKHRVGKASALHVMEQTEPERVPDEKYGNEKLVWIGPDQRGPGAGGGGGGEARLPACHPRVPDGATRAR